MKNVILRTKYVLLALIIALTFSCSPEDGEIGPQGPQGSAGEDGNANVTSIILEDVSLHVGINNFNIPELTRDIVNNGVVFGYVGSPETYWTPLPLIQNGSETIVINLFTVGIISISSKIDIRTDLRFVIIEGN